MNASLNIFAVSQRQRDRRCRPKDSRTLPILSRILIRRPRSFHAILMPNCYGPEVQILRERGVPDRNVWAIEREREDLVKMRRILDINLLPRPMDVDEALDHIWAVQPKNNLIYLDFFSQPTLHSHIQALLKVFSLGGGMLKPGGKLLLTFGRNRCRSQSRDLNQALGRTGGWKRVPQHFVDIALAKSGHRRYVRCRIHEYTSLSLKFVITEVDF